MPSTRPPWTRSIRPFFDLLFPRFCTLCNRPIVDPLNESLCEGCWQELSPDPNRCQRCSAPVSKSKAISPKSCSLCKRDWKFRRVYCLCTYRNQAAKIARRMKSSKYEPLTKEVANRLGDWFLSTEQTCRHDLLVSVPQYWMKRWRDRYNQSDVLAKVLSKKLAIPYAERALVRTKWTEKQGTKTIEERLRSVLGSISHDRKTLVKDRTVLIVDDILTSGATANEAAKALMAAGAKKVDVIVFARGASSSRPGA
ncbi:ComF family protein [Pirellulaceae bacterium SH467]